MPHLTPSFTGSDRTHDIYSVGAIAPPAPITCHVSMGEGDPGVIDKRQDRLLGSTGHPAASWATFFVCMTTVMFEIESRLPLPMRWLDTASSRAIGMFPSVRTGLDQVHSPPAYPRP